MKEISFKNDVMPLGNQLFRLALRITLNRQEAEDVVQDTLMKLWNQRDEWNTIQNIEHYAMTICRNLALDLIDKRERQTLEFDPASHDQADNAPTPDQQLIQQQQLEQIKQIIDQLPEKQRTTLQLRDIEGKSYQEIADMMRITVSDVKVNIFRARQAIKNKITPKQ